MLLCVTVTGYCELSPRRRWRAGPGTPARSSRTPETRSAGDTDAGKSAEGKGNVINSTDVEADKDKDKDKDKVSGKL